MTWLKARGRNPGPAAKIEQKHLVRSAACLTLIYTPGMSRMKNAAEKLAGLSPVELSRIAKGRKGRTAGAISRRVRAEAEPASSAQQRIWLAERLTPNTSQYHVPLFTDLEGEVKPSIVEKSLAKLIERHGHCVRYSWNGTANLSKLSVPHTTPPWS